MKMYLNRMESGNIGDWEQDVTSLSDEELAQKLRELGANIGPITASTRAVYQRKLQRWLKHGPGHSANSSSSHGSLDDSHLEASHMQIDDADVTDNSEFDAMPASRHLVSHGSPERKTTHAARSLPAVSQEDIDLVDRVMASGTQSTSYQTTSYQSRVYQESARELTSDELGLRSRYSVTPRPSLQSYKDGTGNKSTTDTFRAGQSSFADSPQVRRSDQSTVDSPRGKSKCGGVLLVIIIIIVVLLTVAVVYNMEPAYTVPHVK